MPTAATAAADVPTTVPAPPDDDGSDDVFMRQVQQSLQNALTGSGPSPETTPGQAEPRREQPPEPSPAEPDETFLEPAPLEEDEEDGDTEVTEEPAAEAPPAEPAPQPGAVEEQDEDETEQRQGWPASALRRVGKQSKRIKQLESVVGALLQRMGNGAQDSQAPDRTASSPAAPAPPPAVPTGPAQFEERIAKARQKYAWALANQDGADGTDEKGNPISWSRDDMVRFATDAITDLTRAQQDMAVWKADYSAQSAAFSAEAFDAYPTLKQRESDDYQIAAEILRQQPALRASPDFLLWIGDAIAGRKARLARKLATQPAVPVRHPPAAAQPARRPARQPAPGPANPRAALEKRFWETGDSSDAQRLIESLLITQK